MSRCDFLTRLCAGKRKTAHFPANFFAHSVDARFARLLGQKLLEARCYIPVAVLGDHGSAFQLPRALRHDTREIANHLAGETTRTASEFI